MASLGLHAAAGCDCERRAQQMDAWSVAGCRANRETIVGWLQERSKAAKWQEKAKAAFKAVTAAPWLDVADPLGSIVDEAIRRSEADPTAIVPQGAD